MNSVTINGKTFNGSRSVVVRNGVVIVDGKRVDTGTTTDGILEINVTGIIENLETDASVSCEDVHGDVHAAGSVNCDNIGGSIQAGGSVNCDDVGGKVTAGGSVNYG